MIAEALLAASQSEILPCRRCSKPVRSQGTDTWSDTRIVNRLTYCKVGAASMTAAKSMKM